MLGILRTRLLTENMEYPSQQYINESFEYDPVCGSLTWRKRPVHHFANPGMAKRFNNHFAGLKCGVKMAKGRVCITLNNVQYYLHRIIWISVHGNIPDGFQIDHANGNPSDNRLANLRLATAGQNVANRSNLANNTSGIPGVFKQGGKWASSIQSNGERLFLGYFSTKGLAACARIRAEMRLHGQFSARMSRKNHRRVQDELTSPPNG